MCFSSISVTRPSPVLHSAVARTFLMWSPLVKPVWQICATQKTTLTSSSAKPSQNSPESVLMQVAGLNNGGMKLFAVRVSHLKMTILHYTSFEHSSFE